MRQRIGIGIFIILFIYSFGYSQEKELYQLSGIIKNERLENVPFVHVFNLTLNRGAISDLSGIYTIIVRENDTVLFSCLGFKRKKVYIANLSAQINQIKDIVLETDTIELAEIQIFPWRTYEEFKRAVLNTKIDNEELEIARKNIELIQAQIVVSRSLSPGGNYRQVMMEQFDKNSIRGQYQTISILNPFAWAKFIKALKEGEFKKKEKKSD